jgi:hypothetical protein
MALKMLGFIAPPDGRKTRDKLTRLVESAALVMGLVGSELHRATMDKSTRPDPQKSKATLKPGLLVTD